MAEELQIRGSNDRVKVRSPWAVALLPLVTLGIYHLVWWYRINCELRDLGRARGRDLGQNPTNSVLALFPGGLIIVPPLVSYWRGTERVQEAARIGGREPVNGWIALILFLLLSIGLWAYLQYSLNEVWRSEAEPSRGQAQVQAAPEQTPSSRLQEPSRSEPADQPPPPGSAS
jgi:uncharacterized protein DUF4234